MTKVIVGYTTSIDGFVADEQGGVERLYPDLADLQDKPYMQDLIADTGAVVMGRNTFYMGDPDTYADGYEFQVPIFIVTHHPPDHHPRENGRISYTFVTEGVRARGANGKGGGEGSQRDGRRRREPRAAAFRGQPRRRTAR